MPRPKDPTAGLTESFYANLANQPKPVVSIPAFIAIYEDAKAKKQWVYDPEIKRWQSPDEFLEQEKKMSGGETNRLSRLQVRDPQDGIKAADIQVQSIIEPKAILVEKVIQYYKSKDT